ncbi:hypothetical protein BGZ63DRAFT_362955 [Mariannaea sp. PMI_226]|nr:hypothetical protein BGZ63DRAFT_362955 [Mariannaea sp. PMI_226]
MCSNSRSRGYTQNCVSICAAPGTACRNLPYMLAPKIISRFCHHHACKRVVSGRACQTAKYPGEALCREHMRCSAVENGMSCTMVVKDAHSESYQFCSEFHLCTYPNCDNQRIRQNGEDLQFCNDHRCDHDDCRKPKEAGRYCRFHTCEDIHCTSFVCGDTDRFCERHRRCAKPSCSRFCHVRDNGVSSPYCGAHYCEYADCENGRDDGAHCEEHTCSEPGCVQGVEGAKGLYCKEHQCKTKGCPMKRIGRQYCPYHECVMDGCEAEASANRHCDRHQRRPADGRDRHQHGIGCAAFETCKFFRTST